MWHPNFAKVVNALGNGIALQDEVTMKLVIIKDLSRIMQFELDSSFQSFQPHFHYGVILSEPCVL